MMFDWSLWFLFLFLLVLLFLVFLSLLGELKGHENGLLNFRKFDIFGWFQTSEFTSNSSFVQKRGLISNSGFHSTYNHIGGGLHNTYNPIRGGFQNTYNPIGGGFHNRDNPIGGGFHTTYNPIGGGFHTTYNPIGGGFHTTYNPIGGGFHTINNPIGGGFHTTNNPIGGGFHTTNNPIGGGFHTTNNLIGGGFHTTYNPIGGGSHNTNNPIGDGFHNVHNTFHAFNPREEISDISDSEQPLTTINNPAATTRKRRRKLQKPKDDFENIKSPVRNVFSRREKANSSSDFTRIPNVAFYRNQIPAAPNKEHIEDILTHWCGNFSILQENETYLQWLFPNRLQGRNPEAHVLNDEEAKIIRETPKLRDRVKRAFQMMLDFYGMELTVENEIQLRKNCKKRLKKLNEMDNPCFLTITRILLSLKELGHQNLMLPWLKCLAHLIYTENRLCHAKFSFEKYWLQTLDAEEYIQLTQLLKTRVLL